jgi:hypothetical protein
VFALHLSENVLAYEPELNRMGQLLYFWEMALMAFTSIACLEWVMLICGLVETGSE